jgi:hypothetical protein
MLFFVARLKKLSCGPRRSVEIEKKTEDRCWWADSGEGSGPPGHFSPAEPGWAEKISGPELAPATPFSFFLLIFLFFFFPDFFYNF